MSPLLSPLSYGPKTLQPAIGPAWTNTATVGRWPLESGSVASIAAKGFGFAHLWPPMGRRTVAVVQPEISEHSSAAARTDLACRPAPVAKLEIVQTRLVGRSDDRLAIMPMPTARRNAA